MKTIGYFAFFALLVLTGGGGVDPCIEQIRQMIIEARSNDSQELSDAAKALILYTGKSLNNLGNYDSCERTQGMKYALLAVLSAEMPIAYEGTCVPKDCTAADLAFITDPIERAAENASLPDPQVLVVFPTEQKEDIVFSAKNYITVAVFIFIAFLLVFGSVV